MSRLTTSLKIILASASPRRADLLKDLGLAFEVCKPDVEELRQEGENPNAYVRRNASLKANTVWRLRSTGLIIAADTIVVVDGKVLEKPTTKDEAAAMLASLSGRSHKVISGVCVKDKDKESVIDVETEVTFLKLSAALIRDYIATGEPMDKAGAYGAQGIGGQFIKSVAGSYTNVVGLPLADLRELLVAHKVFEA